MKNSAIVRICRCTICIEQRKGVEQGLIDPNMSFHFLAYLNAGERCRGVCEVTDFISSKCVPTRATVRHLYEAVAV